MTDSKYFTTTKKGTVHSSTAYALSPDLSLMLGSMGRGEAWRHHWNDDPETVCSFRTQGRTLMLSIWKRPFFVPNGLKIVKYISPPQGRYTVCQQAYCGWGWSLSVALFFVLEQKFLSCCSFDIIINISQQFSWLSIKSAQLLHWSFLSWVNIFGDFVPFCF